MLILVVIAALKRQIRSNSLSCEARRRRYGTLSLRASQPRGQVQREKGEEERCIAVVPASENGTAGLRVSVLAADKESISGTVRSLMLEHLHHPPQDRAIIRQHKIAKGFPGELRFAQTEPSRLTLKTYDVKTFAKEENEVEGCKHIL